jgi:hypothetical protein
VTLEALVSIHQRNQPQGIEEGFGEGRVHVAGIALARDLFRRSLGGRIAFGLHWA